MKKILCVLLAVTLSLMILPRASRADRLMKDVVGNEWFAEDVRLLMDLGIINGFPDGTFKPNEPFRIDEFLKCLVLALNYKPAETTSDYWAQGFIDTAKEMNWMAYVNDDREFKDYTVPINREQMGVILYAAIDEIPGVQMNGGRVNLMYKLSEYERGISFSPYSQIDGSSYFLLHIYAIGLITGYPDGSFGNKNQLTRAEAAAVLARVVDPSRRIYPDVGFTPPKGKVEVEGVIFDYEKDLIKEETEYSVDYYMSKEMQEHFALTHFKSFQFSEDGRVRFYMPKLPEGFTASNIVSVQYKEGTTGENIDKLWFTEILYGTAGGVPPLETGKWYEYRAEYDFNKIDNISILYLISFSEYYGNNSWYNYTFRYKFPKAACYMYDDFGRVEKEIEITWKFEFTDW
ncbi:MAG: S-layer homology domain-containing protein [Clostridia bacterium]|jgi:hypothetical protein